MADGGDQVFEQGADKGESNEKKVEGEITTEEEEVEPMKTVKTPYTPSASDIAEHRISHLPYRAWCKECVEAFGREAPHHRTEHRASWVTVISCDYLYICARGVFTHKEWAPANEDEIFLKALVIVDSASKSMFAHAVPQKGVDEKGYIADLAGEACGLHAHSESARR